MVVIVSPIRLGTQMPNHHGVGHSTPTIYSDKMYTALIYVVSVLMT